MSLFDILWPLAWPPVYGALWSALTGVAGSPTSRRTWFYLMWASSAGVTAVIGLAAGQWLGAGIATVSLAVALILWWLSRRRRKRAPRAYGAKSAALVADLVRRAREAARPRPVLRPAPGGARA